MFVPEKNKLNRYKFVRIPKPVEMFQRFGMHDMPSQSYTGDDVFPEGRKVDNLAYMDDYDRMMQAQESKKDER